jgi:PAS domain S-box-containing protein
MVTGFHQLGVDALTQADRTALQQLADLLWEQRLEVAETWSRRLMRTFPEHFPPDGVTLEQVTAVNLSFLGVVLNHTRRGDLPGLYEVFYNRNREVVEADLRGAQGPHITLESLYASARVGLQAIGERLGPEHTGLMLAYTKLVAQLMMLVGRAYNDCRERHLREAERALRKSEERLRRLLEATPDAMVIADQEGRIVLVNAQTERLFGYSRSELVGGMVEILVPDRFRALHPQHRAQYFRRPTVRPMGVNLELFGRRKDGTEFPVEISLSPLETEEGVLVTSAIRDITERKRAERLSVSLQEKEVLLKELHHRVKNNLQVISSLLSLQSRHVRDARTLELFKESELRVRLMAAIHDALYRSQDFWRLNSEMFIRDITSMLLRSYAVNPEAIRLHIDVGSVAFGIDMAVPCGLIINELVSNALKHAFPAGRSGEVHVELHSDESGCYILRVSDNGVGLPAGADYPQESTLGWQLVQALTGQLGGAIDVQTDHGTAFTITFFPEHREE